MPESIRRQIYRTVTVTTTETWTITIGVEENPADEINKTDEEPRLDWIELDSLFEYERE